MKGYKGPNSIKRRNANMFAMFERAEKEGRGLVGDSKTKGHGVNSPAMQEAKKAIAKKMKHPVDVKWDKINAEKGLTPKGKRKWHYYNTKVK